ncbi:MAG: DNA-deoxyinosine glycosylase [Luteimonas sp.]
MSTVASFAPIARADARVLVLGSMPGVASLQAQRYYAHPHNHFWSFMGQLVGAGPSLPYPQRLNRLMDAGIALWDVLAECERAGSLDSAIRAVRRNDLAGFFATHAGVRWVLFNGTKAEVEFARLRLDDVVVRDLEFSRLPSTSPANARQSADLKLRMWRDRLEMAGVKLTSGD